MRQQKKNVATLTREHESDGRAARLSDSVVIESFVLLLYGTVCSLIAITVEVVLSHAAAKIAFSTLLEGWVLRNMI